MNDKQHQQLITILGQEKVLEALMQHQNVMAVLPTGSGKSLIYQLYGYLESKLIVVVSPLLSLMQDQVSRMQYLGIKRAVALNSLLNLKQRTFVMHHLTSYRYLYVSPEMLANNVLIRQLQRFPIGLFVIDEAHCISQWGPDFRPEYLNLQRVLIQLKHPLTLMLTATATDRFKKIF
ncbi:MAG: ATP-dependent DNA helicase RecQ [Acetilactobacillus jinshanensis]